MSLTRYSPRGQSVHENDPTMSDKQMLKKYMIHYLINVINLVADEHFRRSDDQPRFRDYKGWTNQIVFLALVGYYTKIKGTMKRVLNNSTSLSPGQRCKLIGTIDKFKSLVKFKTCRVSLLFCTGIALLWTQFIVDSLLPLLPAVGNFTQRKFTVADAMDWILHEPHAIEEPLDPRLLVNACDSLTMEEDPKQSSAASPQNESGNADISPPLTNSFMAI
jgi:hypothetical protein